MGDGREPEPDRDQEDEARQDRSTGGDAPAAASLEEREDVARDDDHLFEGDAPDRGDTDGGEDDAEEPA